MSKCALLQCVAESCVLEAPAPPLLLGLHITRDSLLFGIQPVWLIASTPSGKSSFLVPVERSISRDGVPRYLILFRHCLNKFRKTLGVKTEPFNFVQHSNRRVITIAAISIPVFAIQRSGKIAEPAKIGIGILGPQYAGMHDVRGFIRRLHSFFVEGCAHNLHTLENHLGNMLVAVILRTKLNVIIKYEYIHQRLEWGTTEYV